MSTPAPESLLNLRDYQFAVFKDRTTGILVLHWSRQIGKSFTLAAWAVDRLLKQLATHDSWLITVLSNSRDNGAEFNRKCAEVCAKMGLAVVARDDSPDLSYENMRMECRLTLKIPASQKVGRVSPRAALPDQNDLPNSKTCNLEPATCNPAPERLGRIKVLAANPRTARGFSGDLILDEFAFHEDSNAIWEAAEPILSAHPEYLCRIASTGNGRHNMFYRLAAGSSRRSEAETDGVPAPVGPVPLPGAAINPVAAHVSRLHHSNHPEQPNSPGGNINPNGPNTLPLPGGEGRGEGEPSSAPALTNSPTWFLSQTNFLVSRITRTQAHAFGVPVYDPKTRAPITPDQARARALDKRAYDQNYECRFHDENMALLTHELINAAERSLITVDEQAWSPATLARLLHADHDLFLGNDIGRHRDLSVVTVLARQGQTKSVVGMLRMSGLRLPDQRDQLALVCHLPKFRGYAGDLTGLGLGLVEFLQEEFGRHRIRGVNFSSTEPVSDLLRLEGRKPETARVTEIMATDLLHCFEERSLEIPADQQLRDDLVKPEKITSPGGRVSIAAVRDDAGHADHFWSLALAVRAAADVSTPYTFVPIPTGRYRTGAAASRRNRWVEG